jgi:tetratricopeptide (TPR) repeat protein
LESLDGDPQLLTIQPIFPYFLKIKLNELAPEIYETLKTGFKNYYKSLAISYYQLMDSKDPQERQLGIFFCRLEYENLYQALQICLANQENIDIFFCLFQYFVRNDDYQNALKLSEFVCQKQEAYPSEIRIGEIGFEIVLALERLAASYFKTHNYLESIKTYQKSLLICQGLKDIEEKIIKSQLAVIYFQLGDLEYKSRHYSEARQKYQQALTIYIDIADRYKQANVFFQLGNLEQELKQYSKARHNYKKAMTIYIKDQFRYEQADIYHQLGNLEQELENYFDARQNYQYALNIYKEFHDQYSQGGTYQNLGAVSQALKAYDDAKTYYQEALAIYIEFFDKHSHAKIYHNLGLVSEALGELQEAKNYFLKALSIWFEFNDQHNFTTRSLPNLGRLYQTTQDLSILEAIAQLFGTTVEELLGSFGDGGSRENGQG